MNVLEFIAKHVREDLLGKGYTPGAAQGGVDKALEYYRRVSQSSGKGRMIDDCLREGRLWAEKYSLKPNKDKGAPARNRR
ncbi:hypothetical protein B4923_16350 [Brenneria roseae subsp. americana]|uniref:Uncharacterized protein n=1 Tax=Brenneria roseae subsp. americana TaxID=1508507 RepID=A0A2U1TMP1_9GAMM|nr:hypothetical protein [Brenneria roseae]PWC10687.1 hypothetical protein B4923_16350 [Brenneria roseae subsp. americana]